MSEKGIVITGGPGVGKTTLIGELGALGFVSLPEVARGIIRSQVETGGNAVPWEDTTAFARLMLQGSIAQWGTLQLMQGVIFIDRGLPDTLCYARLARLSSGFEAEVLAACRQYRYSGPVFIAPPWPEIYVTDGERRQTLQEATETFEVMCEAYRDCGYDLIKLPRLPVQERGAFVLRHLPASPVA